MKLNEFYQIADEIAPKALSDEFCKQVNGYDNSGVLVDTGDEINAVLFSLDLSNSAIEKAIDYKVKLIVTHHPAIYGGQDKIRVSDFQPLGEKLVKCIKNGISVISMHLNLDCADGGTDESLKEGIEKAAGGEKGETLAVMHSLSNGGYGRAYGVKATTLGTLAKAMEAEFNTSRIITYGKAQKPVEKVASFCGAGGDERAVQFALEQGADVIVSADFKHHILLLAKENGLNAVVLTHYCAEQYGFEKFYKKIRQSIDLPCSLCTDDSLL